MKAKKIVEFLDSLAPQALQEDYDNAGLLTGSMEQEVSGVLVCLDCTEEVMKEAVKKKCNFIVAHHPIVFEGLKKLSGDTYVERIVRKAIRNNIAVYAFHTNFDNVAGGVNAIIAGRLGLTNCRVLSPKKKLLRKLYVFCPMEAAGKVREAIFSAGAGTIGNYDECSFNTEGTGTFRGGITTNPYVGKKGEQHKEKEVKIEVIYPFYIENKLISAMLDAHPYEEVAYDIVSLDNRYGGAGAGILGMADPALLEREYLKLVKDVFRTDCIRHTRLLGKKIAKVALCGGSGSHLLEEAVAAGAHLFISSDFRYHRFFDADNRIVVADIGHYESERFVKTGIRNHLRKKFPTFAVHLSQVNTNPVKYLM